MYSLSDIKKDILDSKSILMHCHTSPDPDSIGSVLGLKLALEKIGKVVNVYCEDNIIRIANFLPDNDKIEQITMSNALTYPHDLYLALDTAKWELATHREPVISPNKGKTIVIDHHPDNNIDVNKKYIDSTAASTAQIILQLLKEMDIEVDSEIATCLLFGLLGDTNVFQNTNTDRKCFEAVTELVDYGAHYHEAVLHLTRSYIAQDLRTWGRLLQHLTVSTDGHYAFMTLDHDEYQSLEGDTKIGVMANNFAGRIEGTYFGAVVIEKHPGITKGSLRSRVPEFDVSKIAHLLGGGGHKASASFEIKKPLKEAKKDFLKAVQSVLNEHVQ